MICAIGYRSGEIGGFGLPVEEREGVPDRGGSCAEAPEALTVVS